MHSRVGAEGTARLSSGCPPQVRSVCELSCEPLLIFQEKSGRSKMYVRFCYWCYFETGSHYVTLPGLDLEGLP